MTGRSRSGLCAWLLHMGSCWFGCFDPNLYSKNKKIKDTQTQTPTRAVSLPPVRKDFQTEADYARAYLAWNLVAEAEASYTRSSEFNFDQN